MIPKTEIFKIPKVVAIAIFLTLPICAQETKPTAAGADQENSNKQIELSKQKYERLRKADFAKLDIARRLLELNENPDELLKPFTSGTGIYFRLLITNASNDPVGVPIGDIYRTTRLLLFRNGDPVPYRKEIDELLVKVGDEPGFILAKAARLDAGKTIDTDIALKDWYEPLKPGYYELRVKMRFIWHGTWVESSAITFEVEPDQKK